MLVCGVLPKQGNGRNQTWNDLNRTTIVALWNLLIGHGSGDLLA